MKKDLGAMFQKKMAAGEGWVSEEMKERAAAREKEVFTEKEKLELEAEIMRSDYSAFYQLFRGVKE